MIGRALESLLYRAGVIARLQRLWKRDIRQASSEGRRTTRQLMKSFEKQLKTTRLKESAVATDVRRLEAQVAEFQDTTQRVMASRIGTIEKRLNRLELVAIADARQSHLAAKWEAECRPAEVSAHITTAVRAARLYDTPSPHLVIDGLFPQDLHELLLTTLPGPVFFPARRRSATHLRPQRVRMIPSFTRVLWRFIDQQLAATIATVAQERLSPFIAGRYQEWFGDRSGVVLASPHGPFGSRLTLWRHGHREKPHFEPKRACATVLVNIGPRDASASCGVELYRLSEPVRPMRTTIYYPEEHGVSCTSAARISVSPNSAVVLLNAGCAHAAYVDADGTATRRQYAFEFHVGPTVPQLLRVVSKLPREEQQPWIGLMAVSDE